MEETLVALARLDAFVATTICCLLLDRSDKRVGNRQKVYHDTFFAYLPVAYDQQVRTMRGFIEERCSDEFCVSALSFARNVVHAATPLQRQATLKVFILSIKKLLITVSAHWFIRYISTVMSTIRFCYILEYENTAK